MKTHQCHYIRIWMVIQILVDISVFHPRADQVPVNARVNQQTRETTRHHHARIWTIIGTNAVKWQDRHAKVLAENLLPDGRFAMKTLEKS
jgi:hypothetical protein